MKKRVGERTFWVISLALFVFLGSFQAFAKPISIKRVSDLNFGGGVAGDSAKVVAPATFENAENASFTVTGDKNVSYTIVLPASMLMEVSVRGSKDSIVVSNFQSHPSMVGNLGNSGSSLLLVGATRSALRLNQLAGSYSGSFSVTVVY